MLLTKVIVEVRWFCCAVCIQRRPPANNETRLNFDMTNFSPLISYNEYLEGRDLEYLGSVILSQLVFRC